jgi:tRNA threonylcarbamoyl adenosine modification protein (Sua5/YciO/YrdC/YwlC family)
MAQYFGVHPDNPQQRVLQQAAEIIRRGGIVALPTDSSYALACHTGDKEALDRMRQIRGLDDRHHLTLMCRNLADIGQYARVDNAGYRLLKSATPGSYVFILEGTRELPRRILHPKRKTIGVRIPDHRVVQRLLEVLGEPLLTGTLQLPGDDMPMTDAWEIRQRLDTQIDLVLDGGFCGNDATTVIDLTGAAPEVVRVGRGPLEPLGLA